MSDKKKTSANMDILITSLKLMLIAFIVTGILAVVYGITKDKIAAAAQEAQQKALKQSLPGAAFTELMPPQGESFGKNIESIYEAKHGGVLSAYAVIVSGDGFGGEIRLLVLADAETLKIKSVTSISNSETRGIGSKVFSDKTLSRYEGMTGNITFSENPAVGVQAVSGATITSEAVRTGVNNAMEGLKDMKGGGAGE